MLYSKYLKRFFSIIFSLLLLLVLSPIMLVVAILIRVKLGSPVLFVQERVGYREKVFNLIKFRTMSDKRDAKGNLLPDSERQTKPGND